MIRKLLRNALVALVLTPHGVAHGLDVGGAVIERIPEEAQPLMEAERQAKERADTQVAVLEAQLVDTTRTGTRIHGDFEAAGCFDADEADGATRKACRDLRHEDRENLARHLEILADIYDVKARYAEKSGPRQGQVALMARDANLDAAAMAEGAWSASFDESDRARLHVLGADDPAPLTLDAHYQSWLRDQQAAVDEGVEQVMGTLSVADARARARHFPLTMALKARAAFELARIYGRAGEQYRSLASVIRNDSIAGVGDQDVYRPPAVVPQTLPRTTSSKPRPRPAPAPPRTDADLDREVR